MLSFLKEKSWSIRLANGFVLNGNVKSDRCLGCDNSPRLLLGNCSDPNLLLYGCTGHKCKHTLIRVRVGSNNQDDAEMLKSPEIPLLKSFDEKLEDRRLPVPPATIGVGMLQSQTF
jgi:hypothetical protein